MHYSGSLACILLGGYPRVEVSFYPFLCLWGLVEEKITKLWDIHTIEFYSAVKQNKIMSFAVKWMKLEKIMLSEISQPRKVKGWMFFLICGS